MTAAAWWGSSHFLPQPTEIIKTDSIKIQQEPAKIILPKSSKENSKKDTQPPSDKQGANKDSSVIYQRELY